MDRQDDLLGAVGDAYAAEILCAAGSPRSARELSETTGIPIATCYRRVDRLVEAGLLSQEGRRLSEAGRRTTVYQRTVDEVHVDLTGPEPRLALKERTPDAFGDGWREVPGEGRADAERSAEAEP